MEKHLLSAEEWEVATNADWLYRKNRIMEKVILLLGQVQEALATVPMPATHNLPETCQLQSPKISKGEKYLDLPYAILDYPRLFRQQDIFAFRTMFWWGHYFTCTLHLGGAIKTAHIPALLAGKSQLEQAGISIYRLEDPWQHDFENNKYQSVATISREEWHSIISHHAFIKLAKPFPLNTWENMAAEAAAVFTTLLQVLEPGG